jgi:CubicO group peptidase (beta-lactamase class C family)
MVLQTNRLFFFSLIFLLLVSFSSCHVVRYVWWNYADADDYKKFPADTIRNTVVVNPFHTVADSLKLVLPDVYHAPGINTLEDLLSSMKTLSFLVVRNDSLVYEKYWKGMDKSSVLSSFSVSKSVVAALVGIAVSEGKIKSIHQSVSEFLPEMHDPGFSKVTIEDLLTMRSGIKFNEGYKTPFGEMAKFYYGKNLKRYTLKLRVKDEPGKSYAYQSGNVQILAMILEKATGQKLTDYLAEKIWKPAGMEYPATWSTDSRKHDDVKAFCCINARAVDFAKFGELFLDHGKSGDKTIIPSSWIDQTLDMKSDSRDSQGYPYTYLWRVTKEKNYFAKGILGQFIYVCPDKHTVFVRLGEDAGKIVWPELFRLLSLQL